MFACGLEFFQEMLLQRFIIIHCFALHVVIKMEISNLVNLSPTPPPPPKKKNTCTDLKSHLGRLCSRPFIFVLMCGASLKVATSQGRSFARKFIYNKPFREQTICLLSLVLYFFPWKLSLSPIRCSISNDRIYCNCCRCQHDHHEHSSL